MHQANVNYMEIDRTTLGRKTIQYRTNRNTINIELFLCSITSYKIKVSN